MNRFFRWGLKRELRTHSLTSLVICLCLSCSLVLLISGDLQAQEDTPEAVEPAEPGLPEVTSPEAALPDIDQGTEINVKNAEIEAIIRIFSKKTKRNYILDERVKGKVSIYLPGRVSTEDSLRILDSVLGMKGFASVPIGENLWKIVPSKEAIQGTIPTILDGMEPAEVGSSVVTRLHQLRYLAADEAKDLLAPLVSSDGLLNAYTGTNSLIIIDSEDNIARLIDIVSGLDVPASDREMLIIPIEHADATDIADKVNEILQDQEEDTAASASDPAVRARLRALAARAAAARARGQDAPEVPGELTSATVGTRGGRAPKIIADQRTNSLIVLADENTSTRIRALVSQLDSEVDRSGFRFYVYACQHANAVELAEVLSGLAGGTTTAGTGRTAGLQQTGTTETGLSGAQSRAQGRLAAQTRSPGQSRLASQPGRTPTSVSFGEDVSITADPATNSLVIYSGRADYEKILELLKQLDLKRRQVLVEAVILEVSIDEGITLGTEFLTSAGGQDGGIFAQSSFGNNLAQLIQNPAQLANFTMAAASSGTLTLPGNITIPTQTVLLNAAASNTNVNVLSAPNILATDNEPAEIIVGQNVPFLASRGTSTDNLSNVFSTVDRQDVGITLRLTPQISSSDTVRLNIFTEVSDVIGATAESELGPTTTVRTSETTVITKNNQMIVIGGLMSDGITSSNRGVPFLKDIPVLGHLFRTTIERTERTNLLIFITPRILKDQFDVREATLLGRDKMHDEILGSDMHPRRDELLFHPDMDKVSKAERYDGTTPTTIMPPNIPQSERSPSIGSDGVLELRMKPKFSDSEQQRRAPTASGDSFVVLQLHKDSEKISQLPFPLHGGSQLAGVLIPEGSSEQARNFFEPGTLYRYEVDGGHTTLRVVGSFTSREEAAELFPELTGRWHPLSPFEIMNLGKRPWVRSAG